MNMVVPQKELNVMSPVWSSSTETTFLQEYEHVIKAMVKKKY